jgi:hypothetical protein
MIETLTTSSFFMKASVNWILLLEAILPTVAAHGCCTSATLNGNLMLRQRDT